MYHDFQSVNREGWKYNYKGSELLAAAQTKWKEFLTAEKSARKKVSDLMGDIRVSAESREVQEAKRDVEFNGKNREACAVYVHEFARTPDREFNLSLGDVVFFGLQPVGPAEPYKE